MGVFEGVQEGLIAISVFFGMCLWCFERSEDCVSGQVRADRAASAWASLGPRARRLRREGRPRDGMQAVSGRFSYLLRTFQAFGVV